MLLSMHRPSKRTFEAFYNVFHNVDDAGEPFPTLGGPSARAFDDRGDLVALHRLAEEKLGSLAYISDNRIHLFVGAANNILAVVLLFGAIFNLFYVTNEERRLGLIAGYIVAFALCVGLLTNARRSEITRAPECYIGVSLCS
jgi:hypothetical protein